MAVFSVEVREPGRPARRVALSGPTEVGRECDGIVLDDPKASRRHALVEPAGDVVRLHDLGSTNGTFLNGTRISGPVTVGEGDRIRVGGTELVVEALAAPAAGTAAPAAGTALPPPSVPVPSPPAPVPTAPPVPAGGGRPPTMPSGGAPAARPALDGLAHLDAPGLVVHYVASTEALAKGVLEAARKARKRLEGFGTEAWGLDVHVCLVDPFPDPTRPGELVTAGSIVDAARREVWMAVTPESPPEPLERGLALVFAAAYPAADELAVLVEAYALHLAGVPDNDAALRAVDLPPLGTDDSDLGAAMGVSFVRFLLRRDGTDTFVRFLAGAQPGRVDEAAVAAYGAGLAGLEQAWQAELAGGGAGVKPRAFLRLSASYLRPHLRRQVEISIYMLVSLVFTTAFPFVTRRLVDDAIPSGELSQVLSLLGMLGVAFAVSLLAGLRQQYLSAYVSGAVVRRLRTQMFERLQDQSPSWMARHDQGDVLSRFFSDVVELEQGLSHLLREGAFQMLSLVVSAVVLLTLNWQLGLITLVGAPVVAVVYRAMAAGALRRSITVQQHNGALMTVAAENYQAQPVVKAFGLERREVGRFDAASDRVFRSSMKLSLFGGLFGLSVNVIVTVLRLGVLGLGAWLIIHGHLSLGGLVAFLGVMGEVISPVTALTSVGQQLQASMGALQRVNEVLDAEPEIADRAGAAEAGPLRDAIVVDALSFRYGPERTILDGVDLRIAAGSRTAIVGPSGSGKSTLLQLLLRFQDPSEGAVRWDGADLRDLRLDSVRARIGVVFQDTFCFDTTIRENIRMGRPEATDAEVEEAARLAELHAFVAEQPRGYDTVVGERGGRLSGGQRQRLAIARALVRNPSVLLLDEATSALDPRTERLVGETLARVSAGRTVIAVTHRLASIADYDQVIVVDGRIVERGTHAELLAAGGLYATLWAEQTGGEAPPEAPFDAPGALARVPLFSALGPDALADVSRRLVATGLPAGGTMAEGGGRLVLVRSGHVEVVRAGFGGEDAVVARLGPGDTFGLAALTGRGTGAHLRAPGRVGLLVLEEGALRAVAAEHPSVSAALTQGTVTILPAGGRRLARLTIGPQGAAGGGPWAPPVPTALPAPSAADLRRATGSFPRVG